MPQFKRWFDGRATKRSTHGASTDLPVNRPPDLDSRIRFECAVLGASILVEEVEHAEAVPDRWMAQHLDRVLQFVPNRDHELTARRFSRTDVYAKKPVRAGHTHPEMETRSDTEATLPFLYVDYSVAVADRLDQTTKRWRAVIAHYDSCVNHADVGTDSIESHCLLVSTRRSVHDECGRDHQ